LHAVPVAPFIMYGYLDILAWPQEANIYLSKGIAAKLPFYSHQ
jgi:hypothetical protein